MSVCSFFFSSLSPAWYVEHGYVEFLQRIVYKPVAYGALTQLYAGTSPNITADKSGSYLVPLAKFTNKLPHEKGNDEELQERVWEWNMQAMQKAKAD